MTTMAKRRAYRAVTELVETAGIVACTIGGVAASFAVVPMIGESFAIVTTGELVPLSDAQGYLFAGVSLVGSVALLLGMGLMLWATLRRGRGA